MTEIEIGTYSQRGEPIQIPDQLHMAWRNARPVEEGMTKVGNGYGQFLLKPSGGMWTSSLIGTNESAFSRLTASFAPDNEWLTAVRWRLTPLKNIAVYVVDTDEDFGRLFEQHWQRLKRTTPEENERAWDGDEKMISRLRRRPSLINWKQFAYYFDCLWARNYFPPAWDCESLFWTRWCFEPARIALPDWSKVESS